MMPGISRIGVDIAGGTIIGNLAPTVRVNGSSVAVTGASVASHGIGPHASPTMSGHSSTVRANSIFICRAGDAATCGDTASGSATVRAG